MSGQGHVSKFKWVGSIRKVRQLCELLVIIHQCIYFTRWYDVEDG